MPRCCRAGAGAAPIQRAILAGDRLTGVTIMQMEKGLDTGPMLAAVPTAIERKTAGELTEELAEIGAALMVEVLAKLDRIGRHAAAGRSAPPTRRRSKSRRRSSISPQPADQVERQVRAFNPAPGAYFEYEGERIKVLAAEISELSGAPGTVLDHGLAIACGGGRDRARAWSSGPAAARWRPPSCCAASRFRRARGWNDPLPPHHRI